MWNFDYGAFGFRPVNVSYSFWSSSLQFGSAIPSSYVTLMSPLVNTLKLASGRRAFSIRGPSSHVVLLAASF